MKHTIYNSALLDNETSEYYEGIIQITKKHNIMKDKNTLTIDLSKLTRLELLHLTQKVSSIVQSSNIVGEMSTTMAEVATKCYNYMKSVETII